jgi:hypothetical protein
MRSPAAAAVLFLLSILSSGVSSAASNKLIAVLPLDVSHAKQKLDEDARASLEEMLRDVATEALASQGWTVLATQNMLQTLRDNGVDPTKCGEEDCQVSTARELKAAKFISGAVQWVEGEFTASIRLIDTETGRILTSARLEGDSVKALRRAFEAKAADFFVQGQMISGEAAGAGTTNEPPPSFNAAGPRVKKGKVTAALGTLTITAKPRELVRLDIVDPEGRQTPAGAPYENKAAKPGTWKITASAAGFGDETQTVNVAPDDVTLVKFDLKALGGLSIQGTPAGAAVSVSGPLNFRDEGGLPWEASGLHAGTYTVRVTREGYADDDESVEVKPGETATVPIALHKREMATPSEATRTGQAAPAPAEDPNAFKAWRLSGIVGVLGASPLVIPLIGASAEFSSSKALAYFIQLGVTVPVGVVRVGFAYGAGIRWYFFDGLHVGALYEGWLGSVGDTVGTTTISTSAQLNAIEGELGYRFAIGAFAISAEGRVGYGAVSLKTAVASASVSANGLAYSVSVMPGVRF